MSQNDIFVFVHIVLSVPTDTSFRVKPTSVPFQTENVYFFPALRA